MGRISKGILGGFSGTVGTVVGGNWKGISYMRSQSDARRTTFTQPQLDQQAKFSVATKFLQTMNALLEVSFRNFAVRMTGINSALSYTLKHAITGAYPAFAIDYSMALVSRGDLPNASGPTASATVAGKVTFSWADNSGNGKAAANDKAIFAVYCAAKNQCIYTTAGPARSAGTGLFDVPVFSGQQVQTFIGFISADGKDIASSIFTGQLTVL
jgi:uncharacterized protein DUF6266